MTDLFLVFDAKRRLEVYHNLTLTILSADRLLNREAARVLIANLSLELYVEVVLARHLTPKECVLPDWVCSSPQALLIFVELELLTLKRLSDELPMNIQMRADFAILKGDLSPWIKDGLWFLQTYKVMTSDPSLAPYFYRLRTKKDYSSCFRSVKEKEFKFLLLEVVDLLSKASFTEPDAERVRVLFTPKSAPPSFS